ncbi:MAG: hypothetical protein NPINA01_25340 [Nitrospinaceae bacterium]|nr:MAG: hypothetical protein NPINA01_25340 [Nitrospinaceae bacterium]
MKTKKIIIASATALTLSLGSAVSSLAHTGHDHSSLPLNWTFANGTAQKVAMALDSQHGTKIKGLSKFEQKMLDHYGIKVGNTFKSLSASEPVQVKRTTLGIEIEKIGPVNLPSTWQIPLRKNHTVSLASTGAHQHGGHDHSQLPYEWQFSRSTENKIQKRMASSEKAGFVGLTRFEQKLLDRYGIKVGNRVHSVVDGQKVIVERTSGGIRTLDSNGGLSVASNMETSNM